MCADATSRTPCVPRSSAATASTSRSPAATPTAPMSPACRSPAFGAGKSSGSGSSRPGTIDGVTAKGDEYAEVLTRASEHAQAWLDGLPEQRVAPSVTADELRSLFGGPLGATGRDPAAVVDELAANAPPGLMAIQSGRFFGWVMGGTLPAALGADWLVSAWDQNTGLRYATPATAAIEEAAAAWLLDLLGLPAEADVGFVTGATMANFTGL